MRFAEMFEAVASKLDSHRPHLVRFNATAGNNVVQALEKILAYFQDPLKVKSFTASKMELIVIPYSLVGGLYDIVGIFGLLNDFSDASTYL